MLRRKSLLLGLAVWLLLIAAYHCGLLRSLELRFYDLQLRLRAEQPPHPDLAIIAVDDRSLDRLGPWPWPRSVHARLLEQLVQQGGARVVAFDLLFLEQGDQRADDLVFAQAARRCGNVFVASYFTRSGPLTIGRVGVRMQSARQPCPALCQAVAGVGPVNVFPDRDGLLRAAPMVLEQQGNRGHASLALCIANYLFNPHRRPANIILGHQVRLGDFQVPVNEAGEMLINYPGGFGIFSTFSYCDVLAHRLPTGCFKGKVALVGFTATGLSDLRPTPFSPACPGVEVNASILDTLLKGSFLRQASPLANHALLLAAVLLPAWLLPLLSRGRAVAALGMALVVLAVGVVSFHYGGCWVAQGAPLLGLAAVATGVHVLGVRERENMAIHISSSISALSLATRMIAVSTSTASLVPAIAEEIKEVMQASRTALYLPHPEQECLVSVGLREPRQVVPGQGVVGQVASSGRSLLLGPEDEARAELAPLLHGPVSSALVTPLRSGSRLLGLVLVADRTDHRPYTPDDLELLNALAYEAAVAMENAELYGKLEGRIDLANQELRRAYARLNAEKERFEALLENMADAVYMTDTAGTILFLNPAARQLFGVAETSAVGQRVDKLVGVPALAELISRALSEQERLVTTQVELLQPGRKVLNATAARVSEEEGQPVGVVTVLSDVTLIQELSDMKTEFVSLVSHELRTPLTSIQGFTQTLQEDTAGQFDEPTRQEFLGIIYQECQRLLAMINELLDASRLEAGRPLLMNWAPVDLPALVDQVVTLQRSQAEQHTFIVDFPPGFPAITADRDRIQQVLVNLLSNAIKYSPRGGEVRITGQVQADRVLVTMADQGLGMTPDQMAQLFQRYHRVDQEATKRIRGTGLGLYLTKGLVEAHHGRIWAESAGPGQGSTFYLELPISQPETA